MENLEITYTSIGDYYYPNLALPAQEQFTIGKYGLMRLDYLKKHRKGIYATLVSEAKLNAHLHEIDLEAKEMLDALMCQLKEKRHITEKLKAKDQMRWVQEMNNAKTAAEEIIMADLIY